ncbi:MAG: hypothetical protein JST00_03370 [Deltaproteobacteria bacterium]|nr:hypothetical protein [Deltaproteobacteria bacterium]
MRRAATTWRGAGIRWSFLAATALVACAGPAPTAPPVAPSPPAAPSAVAAPTQAEPPTSVATPASAAVPVGGKPSAVDKDAPKLRLGHYSSPDGLFGFVLDRTASPPRAKIDGQSTVMDLAVRRDGSERTYLLSAGGELSLVIDEWGRLSRIASGTPTWLRRDGDAAALGEPAAPPASDAMLREAEAKAKDACGTSIRFEVQGKAPAARGVHHTVQRTVRVLTSVCRDAPGKDAVKKKLQKVAIGHAASTKVTFASGTLTVAGPLDGEGLGPYTDEIEPELEGKL